MLNRSNVNKLISPFLKYTYLCVNACEYRIQFPFLNVIISPENTKINFNLKTNLNFTNSFYLM